MGTELLRKQPHQVKADSYRVNVPARDSKIHARAVKLDKEIISEISTAKVKGHTSMFYKQNPLAPPPPFSTKGEGGCSHCIPILAELRSGFIECRAGQGKEFIKLGLRNRQRRT